MAVINGQWLETADLLVLPLEAAALRR